MPSDSEPPAPEDGTYSIVNPSKKRDGDADDAAKAPSLSDLVDLDDDPASDEAVVGEEQQSGDSGDGDSTAARDSDADLPTLHAVEPLIAKGSYQAICELLGPLDRAEGLGPALALIYATASKEVGSTGTKEDVNPLAIRSVAALLDVSDESRTALMVAKRILRRNPVVWQKRKAPGAPARIILIVFGLALGILGGWLSGPGSVRLNEVIEAMLR